MIDRWLLVDSDRATTLAVEIPFSSIAKDEHVTHMRGISDRVTNLILVNEGEKAATWTRHANYIALSKFIGSCSNLYEIQIRGYAQDLKPGLQDELFISQPFSIICKSDCILTQFTFMTAPNDRKSLQGDIASHEHGIKRIRRAVVKAVLKNKSLLSIILDIRHKGKNILTTEDEATIQQHIEKHIDTLRNEISNIIWQSSIDENKTEYIAPAVSDLIFQYYMPEEE
jgi:hypothetical protein